MVLISQFADEVKGDLQPMDEERTSEMAPRGLLVFGVGVGALLFVPVFKTLTGEPPWCTACARLVPGWWEGAAPT